MVIKRLSSIVRVNVVLNRTVVVDSDWRFDNLCGSHLQSQSELYHVSPIQDYVHPDDQTQPFKPFTVIWLSVVYIRACINWLLNLKGALILLFVYNHQNSTEEITDHGYLFRCRSIWRWNAASLWTGSLFGEKNNEEFPDQRPVHRLKCCRSALMYSKMWSR